MKTILVFLAIMGALGFGCGLEKKDCTSHAGKTCKEGTLYWKDSCGNKQEEIKYCPCGCNSDNTDCQGC